MHNFGDGTLGCSDRPTLTFAPQRPPALTKALLTQVSLETLYLFSTQAGDVDRVLRLFVRRMKGIENATPGGGPIPVDPPRFGEFRTVSELLGLLEKQVTGILTVEWRTSDLPESIPVDKVDARNLVEIKRASYGVRPDVLGSGYQLTETKPVRSLELHPRAIASPEVLDLARRLGLQPYQSSYPVEEAPEGQFLRTDRDPPLDKIIVTTRSILEVMYLLSKTVGVPEEHCRKALARFTTNPDGSGFDWKQVSGDLFRVCVAKTDPRPHSSP